MRRRPIPPKPAGRQKAQSFLEVALFIPILLMMVSSLAEFGFLMNDYLNLMDGPREGARYAVDFDPGEDTLRLNSSDPVYGLCDNTGSNGTSDVLECAAQEAVNAVTPLTLTLNDDVVVSIYSVDCSGANCTVTKQADYSWAARHGGTAKSSRFDAASLAAKINVAGTGVKPSSGIVLVELFYSYHQKLALPWIRIFGFLGILPDPIPVTTYTIMPMPAAEP